LFIEPLRRLHNFTVTETPSKRRQNIIGLMPDLVPTGLAGGHISALALVDKARLL
jgi:hypothetical protein